MKDDFKVLKGNRDENINKEISFERIDKGRKIMSIKPTAFKVTLTSVQLDNFERGLLNVDGELVDVKYSRLLEKEKKDKIRIKELNDMFENDDKIVAFDPYKYKR